ncbi:MAG: DNA replication and repair protein RecF [Gemmatimonadota bacterium]
MCLHTLSLSGFRNLEVGELHFPPQGVAVVGDNAQGKSNLLEAIHYLETFRSFRRVADESLVTFGRDVFRVEAHLGSTGDDGQRQVSAAYRRSDGTKRIVRAGEEVPRMADAIGEMGVVLLTPADVSLVSDGPAERRRFLDILLSLNHPGYLMALQRYRKALSQRNAALRMDPNGRGAAAFDNVLMEAGTQIIVAREGWVREHGGVFSRVYGHVAAGEEVSLVYQPSVMGGDDFRMALERSAARERRLGTTLVGPHRDEMGVTLGSGDRELDLREYGSGGQRRTAALALRMAEAHTVRVRRKRDPIILLDDVFAELDPGRGERILEWMESEETGQVILTAPDDANIRLRGGTLPRWRIRQGQIVEQN